MFQFSPITSLLCLVTADKWPKLTMTEVSLPGPAVGFQGPAFRCDKMFVIVTLLEAIEGIPAKDYNFLGNDKFPNLHEKLLHERKLKRGYLERRIYERQLKE